MTTWQPLHESLAVTEAPGRASERPTDATLDAFERALGFELPESYREFVKLFGPGELAETVRIYAPVGAKRPGDLDAFVRGFRKGAAFLGEAYGDRALVTRAVPFANTVFGDVIAWDPGAPAGGGRREYPVVFLPDDKSKIVALAPDFRAFIVDRCLSAQFGKYIGEPNYAPARTFVAFGALTPAPR